MKKEYAKPTVKIVSFKTENITADNGLSSYTGLQTTIKTLTLSDR